MNGIEIRGLAGLMIQLNRLGSYNLFCLYTSYIDEADGKTFELEEIRQKLLIPEKNFMGQAHAVLIANLPEFIKRVGVAVARHENYEIVCKDFVNYYDPATWNATLDDVEALFWKRYEFSYEREYRIVIHNKAEDGRPICLDVGDLSDIASLHRSADLYENLVIRGRSDNRPS